MIFYDNGLAVEKIVNGSDATGSYTFAVGCSAAEPGRVALVYPADELCALTPAEARELAVALWYFAALTEEPRAPR